MAHKTLIGGTAYEIGGGKTLINGTGYSIDKGKTLVGGTAYEVGFALEYVEIWAQSRAYTTSANGNVYTYVSSFGSKPLFLIHSASKITTIAVNGKYYPVTYSTYSDGTYTYHSYAPVSGEPTNLTSTNPFAIVFKVGSTGRTNHTVYSYSAGTYQISIGYME